MSIQKLAYVTGLKQLYAQQCLEQCNWDYEKALRTFYDAQSASKITREMMEK